MTITVRARRCAALACAATALGMSAVPASAAPSTAAGSSTAAARPGSGSHSGRHPTGSASDSGSAPDSGSALPSPSPKYVNTHSCVAQDNAGVTLKNGVSWAQTQLGYPALWRLGRSGAGQRVAVIDTGVNQVAAFGDRLEGLSDFVVPADNGLEDCDGHGTSVAGLIAAAPDPASGYAGVAPGAQILSIRQSSLDYGVKNAKPGSPGETAGDTGTLAAAIRLAATAGATVINISEASCTRPGAVDDGTRAVAQAVRFAMDVHDAVVVAAAGNVDSSTDCKVQNTPGADPVTLPTPADVPGVLAVAAVDEQGLPAAFSLNGPWVGVAAPGVDIVATDPVPGSTGQINQLVTSAGVSPIQGTSFSAPYVAGLAALVRNRYRWLSAPQVVHRIEATAQHPAAAGDRNDEVGFGMIDPLAALTAIVPGEPREPAATTRSGPQVLPAALTHPDVERNARRVALIGSLGLFVLLVIGAVVQSTRRRRQGLLTHRPGTYAGGASTRRSGGAGPRHGGG